MSSSNTEFDAMMVDWLYGELDPAQAKSFEEHLEAHPEARAEADALKRTRAAFQDLGDAEPPGSLSAILMHEAARAAEPKESMWAKFVGLFQPILLHPAASAMATVVLVAGVAGALYLRNGDMMAEPTAGSNATPPPEALEAARDPAPASPTSSDPSALSEKSAAPADEARDYGYKVDLAPEAQEEAVAQATLSLEDQGSGGGGFSKDANRAKILRSGEREGRADDKKSKQSSGLIGGANSVDFDEAFTDSPAPAGATQAKAQPVEATSKTAKRRSRELSKAKPKTEPERKAAEKLAWEQQKRKSFVRAAESKRCQEAGRIANDILDRNSAFYRTSVEKTKSASACRYYIASETRRRAKSRAKRAAASKSKANVKGQGESVPKKVLAAPREADFEAAE